eukprot:TRINITY_DN7836_c0_g1_i1.p1 TRINITY_DN7836_c0_g1~~TRINITY_DN7836_c0_g1_i1.p1  ORF type:complete len:301 (+),score=63.63 TRINITY_DN7836_c0_g1_i1:222-1124(+)
MAFGGFGGFGGFGMSRQPEYYCKPPPRKGMFPVGTAVVARDLLNKTHLNGMRGVVVEDVKDDRLVVDFSGSRTSIKEMNLEPVPPSRDELKHIVNHDYHPYNQPCPNSCFELPDSDIQMDTDEPEHRIRDLKTERDLILAKLDQFKKARSELPSLRSRMEKAQSAITAAQREATERRKALDREMDQYEIEKVNEVLARTNRTAASSFEVNALKQIKLEREAEDPSLMNTEVQERLATYNFYEQESKLRSLEFNVSLMQSERNTLLDTINNLRQEIIAQQKLTGQIATANATVKLQQEQMW